jgi:opacity protein-like surface antigen
MKKTILSILMIIVLAGAAMGQAEVSLGIKGGANFANLDVSDFSGSLKNKTGFHGGAFALFKFTKFGIQPELLFSQQGSNIRFDAQDIEGSFDYINVPVIFKLYTVLGLNLQIGPQFGFLSKAEFDSDDVKESFKNSDTSLALGVGWELPMRLTVDARYNLGLSDISDDPDFDTIKNQVWQISVGYKLFKFGN